MKICPWELSFSTWADMMKLIIGCNKFANMPENSSCFIVATGHGRRQGKQHCNINVLNMVVKGRCRRNWRHNSLYPN